jgi:hypothetical protein
MTRAVATVLVAFGIGLSACSTTIAPANHGPPSLGDTGFPHDLLDEVQQRFVDARGRVDYAGLQADPGSLDSYYRLLAHYSPDTHPQHFAGEDDRLAYWINAYNAAVLKAVVTYYPIASVSEVSGPPLSSLFSEQMGFFYFQKLVFGGESINLYNLEHDVIRKRFIDPRIHFAINCASLGCPRLPKRAFTTAGLTAALDRETRLFLNEDRNLRVDDGDRAIYLSSILQWYAQDFLTWYRQQHPDVVEPTLLDYARPYLVPARRAQVQRAVEAGYEVRFVAYDWRLNDQAAEY